MSRKKARYDESEAGYLDYVTVMGKGSVIALDNPSFERPNVPLFLPSAISIDGGYECTEVRGVQVNYYLEMSGAVPEAGEVRYAFHNCLETVRFAEIEALGDRGVWQTGTVSYMHNYPVWINPGGRGYILIHPRTYCTIWANNFSASTDYDFRYIIKIWFVRTRISPQLFLKLKDQQWIYEPI